MKLKQLKLVIKILFLILILMFQEQHHQMDILEILIELIITIHLIIQTVMLDGKIVVAQEMNMTQMLDVIIKLEQVQNNTL